MLDIIENVYCVSNKVEEYDNYILLSVPTRFIRDWITSRYLDQILQVIKIYNKNIIRIELKIIEQKIELKEKSQNYLIILDCILQRKTH